MAGILKCDQVQSDSNLSFQVAGANVAYMNSTGLQMTGGQIVAGGNTLLTASGLIYANAGIKFPATQVSSADANTLDDYEEGTWTPTVGGNSTYTSAVGQYVKIGRFVQATFDMVINQIGTGSINSIGGLPFAAGGTVQGQSGSVGYFSGLAAGIHYLAIRLDLGSVDIAIAATQGAQTTVSAGLGIFGNSSRLVATIFYQTS